MTEPVQPPLPPRTDRPNAVAYTEGSRQNGWGLAALITGIVGLVLAIIPVVSFIGWLVALAGIVLAVVGLVVPERRRGLASIGLALGILGIIASIAVSAATVGFVVELFEAMALRSRGGGFSA